MANRYAGTKLASDSMTDLIIAMLVIVALAVLIATALDWTQR
jgi:hypothetical protein